VNGGVQERRHHLRRREDLLIVELLERRVAVVERLGQRLGDLGLVLEQVGLGFRHRVRLAAQRRAVQVVALGRVVDPLAEVHLRWIELEAVLVGGHHGSRAEQIELHRVVVPLDVGGLERVLRVRGNRGGQAGNQQKRRLHVALRE